MRERENSCNIQSYLYECPKEDEENLHIPKFGRCKVLQQQKVTFRIKILLLLLFVCSFSLFVVPVDCCAWCVLYKLGPIDIFLYSIHIVVSGSLSHFWFSTFCDFAVNLFKNSAAKTNIPYSYNHTNKYKHKLATVSKKNENLSQADEDC